METFLDRVTVLKRLGSTKLMHLNNGAISDLHYRINYLHSVLQNTMHDNILNTLTGPAQDGIFTQECARHYSSCSMNSKRNGVEKQQSDGIKCCHTSAYHSSPSSSFTPFPSGIVQGNLYPNPHLNSNVYLQCCTLPSSVQFHQHCRLHPHGEPATPPLFLVKWP